MEVSCQTRTKSKKIPEFDSTTIPGIKKTNDYFLHALARGEIDGRNVGAANGLIHNQIQILQVEYSAEKLATMEEELKRTKERVQDLVDRRFRSTEFLLANVLCLLPENLIHPVLNAIHAKAKELKEQGATMPIEARRYVLEREAERVEEIMTIEDQKIRVEVLEYYSTQTRLNSELREKNH